MDDSGRLERVKGGSVEFPEERKNFEHGGVATVPVCM